MIFFSSDDPPMLGGDIFKSIKIYCVAEDAGSDKFAPQFRLFDLTFPAILPQLLNFS